MKTMEIPAQKKCDGQSPVPRLICFVCTGNTCRSPMAEAMARHLLRLPELCAGCGMEAPTVMSRGLYAGGEPIARNAVRALEEAGVPSSADNPYREHISQNLDEATADAADLLVGMTDSHVFALLSAFPMHASKITRMPTPIPDPFGGDLDEYRACLAAITRGLEALFFGGDET